MQKTIQEKSALGVVDTVGGELISYQKNGREYIWGGDSEYWGGHAPILFPFVSGLKEDKVAFGGKVYSMPRHGFARKSEFELIERAGEKAVFELRSNERTKEIYPYDFVLKITHEISEEGFETTYSVQNTGEEEMLFCIGAHPAFCVEGSAEEYEIQFEQEEDCDLYYPTKNSQFCEEYKREKRLEGKSFEILYQDYDRDAVILRDVKSRRVRMVKKSDGTGIELSFPGFSNLVFWTPMKKRAPFFCVEPWNGLPAFTDESGNFEEKPYRIALPVSSIYSVGYSVKALD